MQLLLDPVIPLVERNGLFQQLLVKRSHVDMEIVLPVPLELYALDGLDKTTGTKRQKAKYRSGT